MNKMKKKRKDRVRFGKRKRGNRVGRKEGRNITSKDQPLGLKRTREGYSAVTGQERGTEEWK